MMIAAVVLAFDRRHLCSFAFETGSAERGSLDGLDRYREARTDGAPGARSRNFGAGRDSLDRRADGRRGWTRSLFARVRKLNRTQSCVELTSPEVEQAARDAESQYKAAEAELTTLRATLQRELLDQEANCGAGPLRTAAGEDGERDERPTGQERPRRRSRPQDFEDQSRGSRGHATRSSRSDSNFAKNNIEPQIASKQAAVDQAKANAQLKKDQMEQLKVRADFTGVLQQLPVEVGQRVTPGTNLARVADPTKLKAEVKIAETQAKDIQIDQQASIDTRNGIVAGHVIRVDPAVEQGTVKVDVALDGELPKGARPDLSVDGTIELERLDNVIYVGRPAFGQENNTVGIFKLVAGTSEAVRTPVKLGPQLGQHDRDPISGLQPGDQVILSDTSAMDAHERIRLN